SIAKEKDVAQQAFAQAKRNLGLAYAKEGSFLLERNRPLDAAFSFYRALHLEDSPGIRAGYLEAIYRSPALVAVLTGHVSPVRALSIHPQSTFLLSGDANGTVKLWNLSKQREAASLAAHAQGILALRFSADGNSFVSAGQDQSIKLWSVARQQVIASQQ